MRTVIASVLCGLLGLSGCSTLNVTDIGAGNFPLEGPATIEGLASLTDLTSAERESLTELVELDRLGELDYTSPWPLEVKRYVILFGLAYDEHIVPNDLLVSTSTVGKEDLPGFIERLETVSGMEAFSTTTFSSWTLVSLVGSSYGRSQTAAAALRILNSFPSEVDYIEVNSTGITPL